jgi:hypothetical protein
MANATTVVVNERAPMFSLLTATHLVRSGIVAEPASSSSRQLLAPSAPFLELVSYALRSHLASARDPLLRMGRSFHDRTRSRAPAG